MIRHLSAQGHEVHVASLVRSREEAREGEGLRAHCTSYLAAPVHAPLQFARMVARLPTPVPSSMGYFYSRDLARGVRRLLDSGSFDLIFVHCSSVAQYVAAERGTPKILDFGDMDSQKWLSYAAFQPYPLSLGYRIEGHKLERAEKALARQFDVCTCTTANECDTLTGFSAAAAVDWFPNGVDGQYFAPSGNAYERNTICFVGRMDYYPNQQAMLEFCATVLPMLRSRRPGVRLRIVGAEPSRAILALRAPDVEVTGSVPDVRPYVTRAALSVAPLRIARGTQNKILESLAMGVPVIASALAATGVDAIPGEHLFTADTPEQWCDRILAVIDDPVLRARFSNAGRERMLSNHSWAASMRRMDDIIARCVRSYTPQRSGAAQAFRVRA
jgi:sugar transferase (PEP-CTERM/EpsH1 system associated)